MSGILKLLLGVDTFQILGPLEELTLCLYEMSSLSLEIFLDLKSTCIFILSLQHFYTKFFSWYIIFNFFTFYIFVYLFLKKVSYMQNIVNPWVCFT